MTSAHNQTSRAKLEAVRADAQRGNGVLPPALRAAVFSYASARAMQKSSEKSSEMSGDASALPDSVRAFVDAVLARAVSADVDALKREGRSDDFIYELSIVAAVAAGSARGIAGLALLDAKARAS
jgi:hypothetical protein